MKTLITGASGFVGSAVLRKLISRGHDVRALVRPSSDLRNISGLQVETVTGDLRDAGSLDRALKGCSLLFHAAADYRLWASDPSEIYETNVTGTRNLMLAAARTGVERIVYTSSVATMGLRTNGEPADERTPVSIRDMVGHYKRSKFMAESDLLRLLADTGLPVVIVNPSTPAGPRDVKPTPTGRMLLDAARGRMPAYVDTGLNIVHVDDVAEGHLLALEAGKLGERYILGGDNMLLREILACVAQFSGVKPPGICLPCSLVMPVAFLSEVWARAIRSGKEPRVTLAGVRMARKKMFFSSEKAVRELGYKHRPAGEALRAAVSWFMECGHVG